MYAFYKSRGIDHAELLFNVLKKYDIETVEKSSAKLPVIIECFEKESLEKFATLSDLPLVFLMFYPSPFLKYDLNEITKYAHGVGPKHMYIFTYKDEELNVTAPSKFIEEAHSLDLSVHPYILQDDSLHYSKSAINETMYYLYKNADGIFTEFPRLTLSLYNHEA